MKLNELRLGNYIYGIKGNKKYVCKVISLNQDDDEILVETVEELETIIQFNKFEPINITKNWLTDFGFSIFPASYQLFDKNDFWAIRIIKDGLITLSNFELTLNYVHELQNLYFAFNKKELLTN